MMLSAKNKPLQYECPVCGYDEMSDAPKAGEICPCCGTQFDSEDYDRPYHELRSDWIDRYMPWFSRGRKPPKDWNPYRQLIIAEHGSDLTAHLRFRTDLDYRSAVNRAFSEVRIAKQLKVLRETRDVPLTQVQLANKAEMKQSRISELEGMNYSSWSISTLERLAKALGVGFKYSFVGWGELVPEIVGGLSREALFVPSFENDSAFRGGAAQAVAAQSAYASNLRTTLSRMLSLPTQQTNVMHFQQVPQQITSQPLERENQLTREKQLTGVAKLSPYTRKATV